MPDLQTGALVPFVDAAPAFLLFRSLMERPDHSVHSLVLLDVDRLGKINALYGPAVGDAVLRQTVDVVRNWTTRPIAAGYWAGDQIVVVLPGVDRVSGTDLIETLLARIRSAYEGVPPGLHPAASAGGATCPTGMTGTHAVAAATRALRVAKRHRGTVSWT